MCFLTVIFLGNIQLYSFLLKRFIKFVHLHFFCEYYMKFETQTNFKKNIYCEIFNKT